jgi:tagatose 1,6-diphosphate aldolase
LTQSKLSVGKRKSLISTSDEAGAFSVLAFDHRQSLITRLMDQGVGSPEGIYETLSGLKVDGIKALSLHASAVLTDPEFGAAQVVATQALSPGTGLIVALEESGYQGPSTARESTLLADWSVAKIRRMGADAVKVLIYYHPDAGRQTDLTENLVCKVVEECRAEDIALFLEAVSYSIDPDHDKKSAEFAQGKPDLIARTAARLSELGADVLKLEFPVDPKFNSDRNQWESACRAVTDAAGCPWTVLSAGVVYELFEEIIEIACSQGASGFMGGRAIWKEVLELDPSARQAWLTRVARDRLNRLRKIAREHATPWWAYYPSGEINNYRDWYRGY